MKTDRDIMVEGISYSVVISDEQEALLAAKAAGRAFVAVWRDAGVVLDAGASAKKATDWLWQADYVVDALETADDRLLERVVRRRLGLPWIIAESERIRIREFAVGDAAQIPVEEMSGDEEAVFADPNGLRAYIESQYGFYEYGIWAVERRSDGRILGAAGVSDCLIRRWEPNSGETSGVGIPEGETQLELGYRIFAPYRRQGYAKESCRLILEYVDQEYGCPVWAVVEPENTASVRLLDRLGFHLCHGCGEPECSEPECSEPGCGAPGRSEPVRSEPGCSAPGRSEPGAGVKKSAERCATVQKCSGSAPPPCLYVRNWR